MKVISYVGSEGDCIVIQRPTDLYALLDWCQSNMMGLENDCENPKEKEQFGKCAEFISELMDLTEDGGFGNNDDIDNIEG